MNVINGFIYSFGEVNEFLLEGKIFKKAGSDTTNVIKVGIIEPIKVVPENTAGVEENNLGHFEGEVLRVEEFQTEKLRKCIDYGLNLNQYLQKIKKVIYLTPTESPAPKFPRTYKKDLILCDKKSWEKITKKSAEFDYYAFELFDEKYNYVGKEFIDSWPSMLLMQATYDDIVAYLKYHTLYEERWPYTHVWQNGLDFAQMGPVISTEKLRIFVLGYFHSFNGLYVRDNLFPVLGPDDYILIADWGAVYPPSSLLISKAKYPQNIFWLANGFDEWKYLTSQGVQSYIVSHNAFVNHNVFNVIPNQEKIYDAVFCQSIIPFKRPGLTRLISNIAYLTGSHPINQYVDMVNRKEPGKRDIIVNSSPEKVANIMNKSYCGLSLSLAEGGNYATTEYLLSGLPVVSTENWGGRNVYLNEANSIFCREDTPEEVARCVNYIKTNFNKYDSKSIREYALKTSQEMLTTLKNQVLKPIIANYGYNTSEIDMFVNQVLNDPSPNSKGRTVFQPEFKMMRIK